MYITDANHGYEDVTLPIGRQFGAVEARCASATARGSGTALVVLPGRDIGRHVVVGAGSVVTGSLPDFSVAVGNPARVIRRYVDGEGWVASRTIRRSIEPGYRLRALTPGECLVRSPPRCGTSAATR